MDEGFKGQALLTVNLSSMCHGQGHINLLKNSERVQGHPNILFFL